MNKRNMMFVKFGIDIVMAITFVLFFNKRVLGGLAFHEIAGIAIAAIFFTHVLLNWSWVKNVTMKLFDRKLPFKTKIGYLLNLLLLLFMSFIIISGILVSKVVFPNIEVGNNRWFEISHITISYLILILVAAHIGLHWKWVVNVFKNITKFNAQKPILGIAAKIAVAALLIFGGYQMYTTNFITHLQGLSRVVTFSSSQMTDDGFRGDGGHFEGAEGDFDFEEHPGDRPDFAAGGFERGEGHFEGSDFPEGDFRGGEGHGSANALGVMVTYFSIMSVFIIIIYYIDKLIGRNKRNKAAVN